MSFKPHLRATAVAVTLTLVRETAAAWGVTKPGQPGSDGLIWLPKKLVGRDPQNQSRYIGPEWLFHKKGLI